MENNALLEILPDTSTGEVKIIIPGYAGPLLVEVYSKNNVLVYELNTETLGGTVLNLKNLNKSQYRFKVTTEILHWEQLVDLEQTS